jgi:hypothetical protein
VLLCPCIREFTRREFLDKAFSATATLTVGAIFGPLAYKAFWDRFGEEELARETEAVQRRISERYGIRVTVDFDANDTHSFEEDGLTVQMRELSSPFLRLQAIKELEKKLAFYPPELMRETIEDIFIVNRVTHDETFTSDGQRSFGVAFSDRHRGFAVAAKDIIFSSHLAVLGAFLPSVPVHHEIGHKITEEIREEEWSALTPPESGYLGPFWRSVGTFEDREHPPGFVSVYARANEGEDIACTFHALMTSYQKVMGWCGEDEVLSLKVEFLKRHLEVRSNRRMGARYWEAIRHRQVDEGYWDSERG